jgi:hypothetical protein
MVLQVINPDSDVQDRLVPFDQNVRSKTFFENAIEVEWRNSVAGIIRTGDLLEQAEDELDRDEFRTLKLPFSIRTAEMLRRIARRRFISDPANHGSLPPCWRTLYELTKASDDALEVARRDGRLHPDLQRKDVYAIIHGLPPLPSRKGNGQAKKPLDPVTTVSASLQALTSEQMTAVWTATGLDLFLKTMPFNWRLEFEHPVVRSKEGREPALSKESEILRQAVSQVRIAAHAADTNAAEIAENLALSALRSLATALVDVDIDRITIINRYVKEKRCAKRKGRRAA